MQITQTHDSKLARKQLTERALRGGWEDLKWEDFNDHRGQAMCRLSGVR